MAAEPDRLARALEAIDRANAEDPRRVDREGETVPLEVLHARRMTHWLGVLDPAPSEAQQVAARAHHLRRWERPRADYPEGRAGYLRWRADAREHHAEAVAVILAEAGWDEASIDEVAGIVRKEGLRRDPAVQTHEDALCLTFMELQAAEFLGDRSPDEARRIVARTADKMSSRGRRAAVEHLALPDWVVELLSAASRG